MAAKNILMMSLLRVLTPEEINELTTKHEGETRVPLTALLQENLGVGTGLKGSARILPFTLRRKGPIVAGPRAQDLLNKMQLSSTEPSESQRENLEFAPDERGNTSHFILSQKEKFKVNNLKLKGREILILYRKESLVDVEQERKNHDNLKKSSKSGVLVDKEQY